MSARPGLCGGHRATGVPTAINSYITTPTRRSNRLGVSTMDYSENSTNNQSESSNHQNNEDVP